MDCTFVTKEMLKGLVEVKAPVESLDFFSARSLADTKARELMTDPVLLSWYDKNKSRFSPDAICCDREKPSWLVYAEAGGATVSVDINDEDYIFVYRDWNFGT
jgi:hypothetical protein